MTVTGRTLRMIIAAVSPATDEARGLICELDTEIAALYPGSTIQGIDAAQFEDPAALS